MIKLEINIDNVSNITQVERSVLKALYEATAPLTEPAEVVTPEVAAATVVVEEVKVAPKRVRKPTPKVEEHVVVAEVVETPVVETPVVEEVVEPEIVKEEIKVNDVPFTAADLGEYAKSKVQPGLGDAYRAILREYGVNKFTLIPDSEALKVKARIDELVENLI